MINSKHTEVKKLTWLDISLWQGENEYRELNTGRHPQEKTRWNLANRESGVDGTVTQEETLLFFSATNRGH